MAALFNSLSFADAIERIVRTMRTEKSGTPFTLIAGAGLSVPVIPTARQMIKEIPEWLRKTESQKIPLGQYRKELWSRLAKLDESLVLTKSGTPDDNVPENIGLAYQLAMKNALGTPALRRNYILDVIMRAGDTTNLAHLFLAAILSSQESSDWKFDTAFCRTIFTTNFDPLLQRALQMMGTLYYISDRPSAIEIPADFESTGIHLIYSHGSMFQYRLANTDDEVRDFAREQEGKLPTFLQRHGVIVVGYSGWSDVCMEALSQCRQFQHNLYWFDIHSTESASERIRPEVARFLAKQPSAYYVPVQGADALFQGLHMAFGLGDIPEIVRNPIAGAAKQLSRIRNSDVGGSGGIETFSKTLHQTLETLRLVTSVVNSPDAEDDWKQLLRENHLLAAIQHAENDGFEQAETLLERLISDVPGDDDERYRLLRLRAEIRFDYDDFSGALSDLNNCLQMENVTEMQRVDALMLRSAVHEALDEIDAAMSDVNSVVQDSADLSNVWSGLHRRATLFADDGRHAEALVDLNSIIEHADVTPEVLANACGERALVKANMGDLDLALADFNTALQIDGLDQKLIVQAYFFRARQFQKETKYELAIDDFTEVIESTDVDRDTFVYSLQMRADCKSELGEEAAARIDYLKAANASQTAEHDDLLAVANRAACHMLGGNNERAISDFTQVIESCDGKTDPEVLRCFLQRGNCLWELQRYPESLADLSFVIDSTAAPTQMLSLAYGLRGGIHQLEERLELAIEDLTRAEELADTESEQIWYYRIQRAYAIYQLKGAEDAITFFRGHLRADPPSRQRFLIHFGLARIYLLQKRYSEALLACVEGESLIETCDSSEWSDFFLVHSMTYLMQEKNDEALIVIQRGLSLEPQEDTSNLLILEAKCLTRLDREVEALQTITLALSKGQLKGDAVHEATALRADLLASTHQIQAAIELCNQLEEEVDGDVLTQVRVTKGQCLLRTERYNDAIILLEESLTDDTENQRCLLYLAVAFQRVGRQSEAEASMQRCVNQLDDQSTVSALERELKDLEIAIGDLHQLIEIASRRKNSLQ